MMMLLLLLLFLQLSQTPPDELILPPITVPKLQMETAKPSTTVSIPFHPF